MKVLAAFLGIFCLLVSVYPCCIDNDCDADSVENIAENEENQQDDDCGLCSPFISCGSCTGFIPGTDATVTTFNIQITPFSNLFGITFKSVEAEFSDRPWQPPQLVIIS